MCAFSQTMPVIMETLPNIPESCDVNKWLETWKEPIDPVLLRLLVKGDVLRRKRAKEDPIYYTEVDAATDILEQALARKELPSLMVSFSTTTIISPHLIVTHS